MEIHQRKLALCLWRLSTMFCKKRLPGYNRENQTYLSLKQSRLRTDIPNKYANMFRTSRLEVFCKKGVLRNFAKLIGKHLCQSLFFNKVAACFPVKVFLPWGQKFSEAETFAKQTSTELILKIKFHENYYNRISFEIFFRKIYLIIYLFWFCVYLFLQSSSCTKRTKKEEKSSLCHLIV